jgi:subtilisin family serine protease
MYAALCRSVAAGVTYVVAAGNDGWDFDYARAPDTPAAYPEALTVTAMGDSDGRGGATGGAPSCTTGEADDRYASFSNFAATSAGAAHVIAGPGVCVRSTWPGGGHDTISGTSMATPHVAALAALCIEEAGRPGPCAGLSPAQVVAKLRSEAQAHTTATPGYGFSGDPLRPFSGAAFGYLAHGVPAATATPAPTPTPTPAPAVSQAPGTVTLQSGSYRSGSVSALGADDDVFLELASTTSGTRVSSWYGSFTSVPRDLASLRVAYRGRTSASCAQTVSVWRWPTGSWVQLDSRTVGTTETLVDRAASGVLGDYVSSAGDVRVRVRCTSSWSSFVMRGDQLRITHTR